VDPGSTSDPLNPEGSLERLASLGVAEFPHLRAAHALATEQIEDARFQLQDSTPADVSVVLFGSWARRELTPGSDNDWAILAPDGREIDRDVEELAAQCRLMFNEGGKAPGAQDVFGVPFAWPPLPRHIGLDDDSNTNLTRRMLTLLESVALTGSARDECWRAVLSRHLEHGVKDHWPPRFLLNDTIRYWRTICVDFGASMPRAAETTRSG
jgi:Putative nucleotidyltransferase DUF294